MYIDRTKVIRIKYRTYLGTVGLKNSETKFSFCILQFRAMDYS